MICKRGGFVIQRHNELRDLEAEMRRMVCNGVETEPVLQDITGEELNRGANTAPDAQLDIVARGFWERQRLAFFDVRICYPNADSYRDMDHNQIYRQHEMEKKRQYASRILEVEQATFMQLVFSTTGGIAVECKGYHSRLAELVATKKGESYVCDYYVMDQGKGVLCVAEISITMLKRSASYKEDPSKIEGH